MKIYVAVGFAIASLTLAQGREEQPGLAIVNNAESSVSIFLHYGLKSRDYLKKTAER